jgi:hypothetical protein
MERSTWRAPGDEGRERPIAACCDHSGRDAADQIEGGRGRRRRVARFVDRDDLEAVRPVDDAVFVRVGDITADDADMFAPVLAQPEASRVRLPPTPLSLLLTPSPNSQHLHVSNKTRMAANTGQRGLRAEIS